jgi:hypothetical protein
VFSVTAFTALLGNVFQQWTFTCIWAHVLTGWRPSHTNHLLFYLLSQDTPINQSQSHIVTNGQSISMSWCRAPSFVYAAGPRQRSLSRVRVPWDLWPDFTASDLRLPFSLSPTTRRVTVEVFIPASTRVTPITAAGPCYIASARTTQKIPLPTVTPLLCYTAVTQQPLFLLLQNSCFEQICHTVPSLRLLVLSGLSVCQHFFHSQGKCIREWVVLL